MEEDGHWLQAGYISASLVSLTIKEQAIWNRRWSLAASRVYQLI